MDIEKLLNEDWEKWRRLPADAILTPKQLAFCPLFGGSKDKPLHLVTLSRWRTRGIGPPFQKLENGRIIHEWGKVVKHHRACRVRTSTTK